MNPSKASLRFIRQSGLYLLFMALTSGAEYGVYFLSNRLTDDGFTTYWALFKLFYIVIAPIMGVQLVVSKQIAALGARNEIGRQAGFVERTFSASLAAAAALSLAGCAAAPFIRDFLNIGSTVPVLLIFILTGLYFPLPIFYGVVQGQKRFCTLGALQSSWALFRIVSAVVALTVFDRSATAFIGGAVVATAIVDVIAFIVIRPLLAGHAEPFPRRAFIEAYSFVVPIILTILSISVMRSVDVIVAKRVFVTDPALSYTTAALVGSAFYMLSGLFMVMFPLVSEEKARGGNPIRYLVRSCGMITALTSIGIVIALAWPALPLFIMTGKSIPDAEPLVRLVGFGMLPLSLTFVMANYFLAKHRTGFLFVLGSGALLQVAGILLFHATPFRLLAAVVAANIATFVGMCIYLVFENRSYINNPPREQATTP